MQKSPAGKREHENLLSIIIEELLTKGIKATTMDSLASSLQMSKRTLYEIFGSKDKMIEEALGNFHERLSAQHKDNFQKSSNVMEAMIRSLKITRNWMSKASVMFFRDFDEFFLDKKKKSESHDQRIEEIEKLFRKGAKDGYFRKDLNFKLQLRMLSIQMESLKRMEEVFPPDISLLEAYDGITLGFLRSVSTAKGLDYIDKMNLGNNNQ